MKVRSGIDIIQVSRMEEALARDRGSFKDRIFTGYEQEDTMKISSPSKRAESFAGRFAAKEACAKALGTGIMTAGIGLTDLEIRKDDKGMPYPVFGGAALERSREIGVISSSVSISHDGGCAVAVCTLLTDEEE